MSLRSRIIATFGALTVLIVAAVALLVYVSFSAQLISVVDAALDDRIVDTARDVRRDEVDVIGDDRLTQILDADGSALVTSPSIPEDVVLIRVDVATLRVIGPLRRTLEVGGLDHRIRVHAEVVDADDGPVVVVVARSLAAVDSSRQQILFGLLVGAPIIGAIVLALGWLLARRILEPVGAMGRRASEISGGEERIDIGSSGGDDEFSELAESFNALLGRISDVRNEEQRFIADVSHELRTPLAIVRGELELLALDSTDDSEVSEALWGSIDEIDRMTNLVGRLLFLARAEAGELALSPAPTQLRVLVDEIAGRLPSAALTDGVEIDTTNASDTVLNVDREVVTQIILNLVANATRHANTAVSIHLHALDDGGLSITVRDDGDGFPAEMIENGIVRFGRGVKGPRGHGSQTRFGLGLAIVEAVAMACGGDVKIANRTDAAGGEVVVRLASPAPAVS